MQIKTMRTVLCVPVPAASIWNLTVMDAGKHVRQWGLCPVLGGRQSAASVLEDKIRRS